MLDCLVQDNSGFSALFVLMVLCILYWQNKIWGNHGTENLKMVLKDWILSVHVGTTFELTTFMYY